jgi:hypothetical protein
LNFPCVFFFLADGSPFLFSDFNRRETMSFHAKATLLIPIRLGHKEGYIDARGTMVIPPRFDGAMLQFSHDGLLTVVVAGKWGIINEQGKEIVAPRFDKIV